MIFDQLISEVRLDLNYPETWAPTDDLILQKAADVAQLLHNQAQNTAAPWSIGKWDIPVKAGQAEYLLGVEGGAKPVRLHTIDSTDVHHISRKIPIVPMQDVDGYYQGPETAMHLTGQAHSAEVAVLYWSAGAPYLRFVPTPGNGAEYRCWYEIGVLPEPGLGSQVNVPAPFFRYLRVATAAACARYAQWGRILGMAEDAKTIQSITQSEQQQLLDTLLKLEIQYARAYQEWTSTPIQSGVGEAIGYGDWAGDW